MSCRETHLERWETLDLRTRAFVCRSARRLSEEDCLKYAEASFNLMTIAMWYNTAKLVPMFRFPFNATLSMHRNP